MLPEQRSIKKLLHKQLYLYRELPALTSLMLNLYPSQVYALTHTNTHTHTSWLPGCSSWSSRVMQEEEKGGVGESGEKKKEEATGEQTSH